MAQSPPQKADTEAYFESVDEWTRKKGGRQKPVASSSAHDYADSKMLRRELDFMIERKGEDRSAHLRAICQTLPSAEDFDSDDQTPPPAPKKKRTDQAHLVGLAFSGGGIRSATFCLGIMQKLARDNIFRHVDYLSTVSGGGYTGSALAWWLSGKPFQEKPSGETPANPEGHDDEDYMPFGTRDPMDSDETDPAPLQHLRRNGRYLIPGNGINVMSGVAVVLRAVLLNLIVWIPIVAFIFVVITLIERSSLLSSITVAADNPLEVALGAVFISAIVVALVISALFAISSLAYSLHAGKDDDDTVAEIEEPGPARKAGLLARLEDWVVDKNWYIAYPVQGFVMVTLACIILGLATAYVSSIFIINNRVEQIPVIGSTLSQYPGLTSLSSLLAIYREHWLVLLSFFVATLIACTVFFGKRHIWRALAACVVLLVLTYFDDVILFALATGFFSVIAIQLTRLFSHSFKRNSISIFYSGRRAFEKWFGQCVWIVAALLVFASIPWFHNQIGSEGITGTLSLVAGAASGLWGFAQSRGKNGAGVGTRVVLVLGAVVFIFGILLVGYAWMASMLVIEIPGPIGFVNVPTEFWAILLISVFSGLITNLNSVSLGRFYRDRLMEAFMPDWKAANGDRASAAGAADRLRISQLWNGEGANGARGPYPVINTNVVLVNSPQRKYRQRGGDNFVITPHVCGSSATGWQETSNFENDQLTLPTAMAISGAAANPRGGMAGKGPTTNGAISTVMTLLNFRLGFWVKQPSDQPEPAFRLKPNHFFPSAAYCWPGTGYTEKSRYLELSDGGHFENLAMYELIRRRARVIFVCDGGQDAAASYSDFVSFLQRVGDDFGAKIDFIEGAGPELLVTKSTSGAYPKGAEYAEKGYFVAKVNYGRRGMAWGGATEGLIIYMKTTMIEQLSMTAKGYKGANPDFPDQTTGDQFFDAEQFEAYREVGYRICEQMIDDLKLAGHFGRGRRPKLGTKFYNDILTSYKDSIGMGNKAAVQRNTNPVAGRRTAASAPAG